MENRSIQELVALYDRDQRRDVVYPDMIREATPTVVRHCSRDQAGEGGISHSTVTAANADEVIREQIAYFQEKGQNFEWKLYDYDNPVDLKERLINAGFVIEESEAIMVLEIQNASSELLRPIDHDVRKIGSPEKISDIIAVEGQVWKEDYSWLKDRFTEAFSEYPDQICVYVAYVEGTPVSAAWMFFPENSQFASLWGGSTLSGYRKQGFYTALLSVRLQEAFRRGAGFLTVDASEMSRPILEKFGFQVIASSYPCKWKVPEISNA